MSETSAAERYREVMRRLRADVKFEDWLEPGPRLIFRGPRGENGVQEIFRGQAPIRERVTDGF